MNIPGAERKLLSWPVALRDIAPRVVSATTSSRLALGELPARVLYVDDDRWLRMLGEQSLAWLGCHVDAVGDGAQAWVALHEQKYDLLITDNQMPRLTGLELIRRVRQARMTIPVILASGSLDSLTPDELSLLDCQAVLAKPFTFEQLVSSVREILQSTQGARSHASEPMPQRETLRVRVEPRRHWGINE